MSYRDLRLFAFAASALTDMSVLCDLLLILPRGNEFRNMQIDLLSTWTSCFCYCRAPMQLRTEERHGPRVNMYLSLELYHTYRKSGFTNGWEVHHGPLGLTVNHGETQH